MHTMFIKVPDREEAPNTFCCCYSVAQSCPTLRPHGLHHARFPCLSPSPRAYSNSCHGVGDAIQPSCPLLSTSPAFNLSQDQSSLMSWLFASDGQSNGASTSASVFPMNIQGWFPLGLTGLISMQSRGLSRGLSSTTTRKYKLYGDQPSLWSSSQICAWLWRKP